MAKIELGSDFYLFQAVPGEFQEGLIISAHGGIRRSDNADYRVIFGTLHFYIEHGAALPDPGIRNMLTRPDPVESVATGDMTYDYDLGKYQGQKHQDSLSSKISRKLHSRPAPQWETYGSIEEDLRYIFEYNQMLAAAGDAAPTGAAPYVAADVLTVRNRFRGGSTHLSDALTAVGQRHQYTQIYCSHCRSYM